MNKIQHDQDTKQCTVLYTGFITKGLSGYQVAALQLCIGIELENTSF
jgi:hypothetical protein